MINTIPPRLLTLTLLLAWSLPALAAADLPLLSCDFASYPAPLGQNESRPLALDSEFARSFQGQLKAAASSAANFAGDQILVTWGCGSGCLDGGLIDTRSGHAQPLPFSLHGSIHNMVPPLQYQADSRLLVASGARSETEEGSPLHCYEFKAGSLHEVSCPCQPPAADSDGQRLSAEVAACGLEAQGSTSQFTACLLATNRRDILRLKEQIEALGGSWQMAMADDDQELTSHFLHTATIIFKGPTSGDKSRDQLNRLALKEHMMDMMLLIHKREELRRDPNTFLGVQPPVPTRPANTP